MSDIRISVPRHIPDIPDNLWTRHADEINSYVEAMRRLNMSSRRSRISESEMARQLANEDPVTFDPEFIESMRLLGESVRNSLIIEDNGMMSYNRQRSMPREYDSDTEDQIRRMQLNDMVLQLRKENADLRKQLDEARAAAGWSNDDSPALGGQHRD